MLEYFATDLTFGIPYEFKIESRNAYSYSAYSEPIILLCAYIPDPPTSITTSNNLLDIEVAWNDPVANGSPITSYRIFIKESDGVTFTEEV